MTLWTPDGERRVPPAKTAAEPTPTDDGASAAVGADGPELSPEDEARAREMAHELAEARTRLMETEVATVLSNHALGIYELAAIHLSADDPDFDEAKLAIDALGALVDGLEGRLGDAEATLRDALHQVRMAFVQRKKAEADAAAAAEEST